MTIALRRPVEAASTVAPRGNYASPRWLFYYYLVQFVCQLALLSDSLAGARFIFRATAFGTSLLALGFTMTRKGVRPHPATPYAVGVFIILAAESLHPETTSPLAALATIAMYAAIIGPLFWVRRINLGTADLRTVVVIIWAFQSVSALVGALQVYFPGTFQPAIATVLSESYIASLKITLVNGVQILRPSGLSDSPGGAAAAGTYSILLGLGLWTAHPGRVLKALLLVSAAVGMFVLYLCQVRSLVVMIAISGSATLAVHSIRGRIKNVGIAIVAMLSTAAVAFIAALTVGGEDVSKRLSTLTSGSPGEVYYTNRGIFLEHTIYDLLPRYPLGAGLGRWGMFSSYFSKSMSDSIYVEIQWTGWLLDGGVLLVLVYTGMLSVTLLQTYRVARDARGNTELLGWAAMLVGYDVGTIALTFNYPVFISALGVDFWLLNTALYTVAAQLGRSPSTVPTLDPPIK